MNDNQKPGNWSDRVIGFGAGLASALIFAASTRGSGLALALAYFTPLPLMIGAIGFSGASALAGVLLGALLLSGAVEPALGIAFLLGFGAPALIAGALTRRATLVRKPESTPLPQYLTPGALLAVLLALCVITAWIGVAALTDYYHGFDTALSQLLIRFKEPLDEVVDSLKSLSPEIEGEKVKRLVLLSMPAGIAASQTLLLSLNLWFAARAVDISGRLGRPWSSLPEHLVLPRIVAPAFVISCGLAFDGGLVGALAGAFAAAAGLCLAIQGLAALHALTRETRFRGVLLSALYATVLVLEPWSLLALALFGIVESVFSLRARKARRLSTKT